MKTPLLLLICLIASHVWAQPFPKVASLPEKVELFKISSHTYLHVSAHDFKNFGTVLSNGVIVVSDGKAILLDTPVTEAQTQVLLNWITQTLKAKIVAFVPNHRHDDCMGGLALLQRLKIPNYASRQTVEAAKKEHLPVPEKSFTDSLNLQLPGISVKCFYPGAAHTTDNIVVWIPTEKVLFAGCMVKSQQSTDLGNMADGDPAAYPVTLRKVLARYPDARIVVPGHGEPGGLELIRHTLEMAEKGGK
ncbi:MAG: subclass B1 metallo-beta-lactamase [Marinilabiliales bacterium]|nr:subclass B1 metallo-beta-lactamase [Marinilabiliales bacterium]